MFEVAQKKKKKDIISAHHIDIDELKEDYRIAFLSRQLSILGRKEVLSGKAQFGIFGDGKEIAQIALAKNFKPGDWRSGYYRDQTFMLAAGLTSPEEFFAQLYSETDPELNPGSSGRNMNNHYCTPNIKDEYDWSNLAKQKNVAGDIAPTAGQMPRLLGLAYASKLFRYLPEYKKYNYFSTQGNEVAFGTIGDSSTSEGLFFETINAAGVLQVPLAMTVWDDGYGISVPTELQTVKGSISEALRGFSIEDNTNGVKIFSAPGWNYAELIKMFEEGIELTREKHIPVLFHIYELTQPLGHSSSGSHERYKSAARLNWEKEFDPLKKMKQWILDNNYLPGGTLEEIEISAHAEAKAARNKIWKNYISVFKKEKNELLWILEKLKGEDASTEFKKLNNELVFKRDELLSIARKTIVRLANRQIPVAEELKQWIDQKKALNEKLYSSYVYHFEEKNIDVKSVNKPRYAYDSGFVNGNELLNKNFLKLFEKNDRLVTFGEDTGKLGDVNQGMKGLQKMFGELRVSDTGIREASIIGQGTGLSLRGLRPVAEIQYLDYLIYGLQTLSDDVATTYYRTAGKQVNPLIIRTRGHRLEGIWHSGSYIGMLVHALRGMIICVPRNMTQAAGFYNHLVELNDPALVIEPLKAYSFKEKLPQNLADYKTPIGVPEVINEGNDITLVTYGYSVYLATQAAKRLQQLNISMEVIDVQTLLPFDNDMVILESLKKTNKIIFLDEDVPGGTTGYMMQKVLEDQGGYGFLDSAPRTISAKQHRPPFGSVGDYHSKPNEDDVFECAYQIMSEYKPDAYPEL